MTAALRDSEQFLLLAENIPTLCWMANADGYIFWYNRRWHDYCGTTPEQMEGWGWQSVHDPAVLPAVMARWTASIASGEPFEMTFPLRGADGMYRPFLTRVSPLRDAAGGVTRWFGMNTDVGAQVEAEQQLRETSAAAQRIAAEREAILGQLGEGVIVTDVRGRITFVNEAATKLHGVARLDVEPDAYSATYNLFTEAGVPYPAHELPLARAVRGETVIDARWQIRRPDGSVVLAIGAARPVHDAAGQCIGAVLTIRDDTQRRAAEEALRTSEATIRAFFQTADLFLAVIDLDDDDFSFVMANRNMAQFWGQTEIDGRTARELLGRPVGDTVMTVLQQGHAAGGPTALEYPYRSAAAVNWFVATLQPMAPGPLGKPRLAMASLDITARKRAEETLAEALAGKDMLLHEVNHRVKNSLQLVTALLSLQARQTDVPELRRSLTEAQARVGVVAMLHERLYATSQHDRVEIASYLRDLAVDTVRALDTGGRITLDIDGAEAVILPIDKAVPLALIVSELLTNAVKYAFPSGGAGRIGLQVVTDDAAIRIRVSDNGCGLPAGFDPTRAGGLGMRIITALVRQLRASLTVTPQIPGTAFEISLDRQVNRLTSAA